MLSPNFLFYLNDIFENHKVAFTIFRFNTSDLFLNYLTKL